VPAVSYCTALHSILIRDKPILSLERMLHKDYDVKGLAGEKKSGCDPQGAWCQEKLIGGKPLAVK
jgi:hypothetical protein